MGTKGEVRRANSRAAAERMFQELTTLGIRVESLIQCGLGDWAEGPALLDWFDDVPWMAVEPIHRYCFEAWKCGFRGPIIQGALWNSTGETIALHDWRTRTSIFNEVPRGLGEMKVQTVTLDDAVKYLNFFESRTSGRGALIWMDVEGCETKILEGAKYVLSRTSAIICELKDRPRLPNWPNSQEMIKTLESYGFELKFRARDDGLFTRKQS